MIIRVTLYVTILLACSKNVASVSTNVRSIINVACAFNVTDRFDQCYKYVTGVFKITGMSVTVKCVFTQYSINGQAYSIHATRGTSTKVTEESNASCKCRQLTLQEHITGISVNVQMGSIKMLQVPEAGAGRNTALCYGDSFHCSLLGGGHAVGWTQDTFWGQSSLFFFSFFVLFCLVVACYLPDPMA